jgi:hypothetical protein
MNQNTWSCYNTSSLRRERMILSNCHYSSVRVPLDISFSFICSNSLTMFQTLTIRSRKRGSNHLHRFKHHGQEVFVLEEETFGNLYALTFAESSFVDVVFAAYLLAHTNFPLSRNQSN